MKKLLAALLLSAVFVTPSLAQDYNRHHDDGRYYHSDQQAREHSRHAYAARERARREHEARERARLARMRHMNYAKHWW
jgi:hypothetical protein